MAVETISATQPPADVNFASQPAPLRNIFTNGRAAYQRTITLSQSDGPEKILTDAFPGVLDASPDATLDAFLSEASSLAAQPAHRTAKADESALRTLLTSSGGALHFRNTPLRTADDFSAFIHTLAEGAGWVPHQDKGLMVLRRPHAKNVASANEGPSHLAIGSHNEYGLSSHHPSFIAFFCLSAPEKRGETPIASSFKLYQRFAEEQTDYLATIEKQGIAYTITHPRARVANSLGGNGVFEPSAFGPQTQQQDVTEEQLRSIVEDNVRSLAEEGGWQPNATATENTWKQRGYSSHWLPDGSCMVVQRVPGVRQHPVFHLPSYFTNVHSRTLHADTHRTSKPWSMSLDTWLKQQLASPSEQPHNLPPYYVGPHGDDLPFPLKWIDSIRKITTEEQVDVPWQQGDVLLLDNLAVQHGRRTWEGDRRLLASLWDVQK
ncbi:Clavaminate synthase-like protein [Acaromyces ingoldii]|uniref:Clavaminate synthase-like protein n=1 Tax=Acaromyces ingoldii TaxID=215250 RepID=A0A316YAB8_9BASI|nr:Clavaminate synthase-like protein [Acaromyces ingoldii]PWN86790.1 Clavaminate synthase-like protein [Acaromyces ingoldii]